MKSFKVTDIGLRQLMDTLNCRSNIKFRLISVNNDKGQKHYTLFIGDSKNMLPNTYDNLTAQQMWFVIIGIADLLHYMYLGEIKVTTQGAYEK